MLSSQGTNGFGHEIRRRSGWTRDVPRGAGQEIIYAVSGVVARENSVVFSLQGSFVAWSRRPRLRLRGNIRRRSRLSGRTVPMCCASWHQRGAPMGRGSARGWTHTIDAVVSWMHRAGTVGVTSSRTVGHAHSHAHTHTLQQHTRVHAGATGRCHWRTHDRGWTGTVCVSTHHTP